MTMKMNTTITCIDNYILTKAAKYFNEGKKTVFNKWR